MFLQAGGPIENRAATPVSPLDYAPKFPLEWTILTGQHPRFPGTAEPLEPVARVQSPEENEALEMRVRHNLITYLTQPQAAR